MIGRMDIGLQNTITYFVDYFNKSSISCLIFKSNEMEKINNLCHKGQYKVFKHVL